MNELFPDSTADSPSLRTCWLNERLNIHDEYDAIMLFQNNRRPQLLISCLLVCIKIIGMWIGFGWVDWQVSPHFQKDLVIKKKKISAVTDSLFCSKFNSYDQELHKTAQKTNSGATKNASDRGWLSCNFLKLSQLVHNALLHNKEALQKKWALKQIECLWLPFFPADTDLNHPAVKKMVRFPFRS